MKTALRPSLGLALLLLLFHAIAACVLYATAMPPGVRLAMFVLILASLLFYLARDALLLFPDSWCEISLGQNRVSVVTRGGSGFSGKVEGNTVITPYFAVLRVRMEGKRLPVSRTIFRDASGSDAFRELCVLLKFSQ